MKDLLITMATQSRIDAAVAPIQGKKKLAAVEILHVQEGAGQEDRRDSQDLTDAVHGGSRYELRKTVLQKR